MGGGARRHGPARGDRCVISCWLAPPHYCCCSCVDFSRPHGCVGLPPYMCSFGRIPLPAAFSGVSRHFSLFGLQHYPFFLLFLSRRAGSVDRVVCCCISPLRAGEDSSCRSMRGRCFFALLLVIVGLAWVGWCVRCLQFDMAPRLVFFFHEAGPLR